MSINQKRRQYKCGVNYVRLEDIKCWGMFNAVKESSKENNNKYILNEKINNKVSFLRGDITTLEVDVIVNAANKRLSCGGGVDEAIHIAANKYLLKSECRSLAGCSTGFSKITGGYQLPAKYIIHTVGPVGEKPDKLRSCYITALDLFEQYNLNSIAFPCISTGKYCYPNLQAAHIALSTVRQWFESNQFSDNDVRIIFCVFEEKDYIIYDNIMPYYFPKK